MNKLEFIKSQLALFSQSIGGTPTIETFYDKERKGNYDSKNNKISVRDVDDYLTIAHEWGHAVGLHVKNLEEFRRFKKAALETPMCMELLELKKTKEEEEDHTADFLKQDKKVQYFLKDCELWANAFAQAFFSQLPVCDDWSPLDAPGGLMDTEPSECVLAMERDGYWPKAQFLEGKIQLHVVETIKAVRNV